MKNIFLIITVAAISVQCLRAQQKEFNWLIGTWKLKDKTIYETWKHSEDGKSLEGLSYTIKNRDTTITEQVKIVYKEGAFHYVPDVAGEQLPVDFKITTHTSDSFVAENPQHDFPKVIRYHFLRKGNKDCIDATIEGNGKVISYFFERLK